MLHRSILWRHSWPGPALLLAPSPARLV